MTDQLDLITLRVSPEEALLIRTGLATRALHLEEREWGRGREYESLRVKIADQVARQLGVRT